MRNIGKGRIDGVRLLLGVAWVLFIAPVAAIAAEPTLGDAKSDFSAGKYNACLQKISRILSGPTMKPGSPERFDALMLRGDCMLALKQGPMAAEAYASASRVMKSQGDLDSVAAGRAMAALVKASPGLRYKRPGSPAGEQGIDIVDPTTRKVALAAFLDDRIAAVEPKVKEALAGTSLVPIHELLPALGDLYAIELAATGDTTRTMGIAKGLGEHARKLMTDELTKLIGRLDALNDLANEPTLSGGLRQEMSYRGLTSPERDELKQIADYVVKIQRAAEEGRRISRRLGGDVPAWDSILADCAVARDRAQQAYDRRY